MAVNLNLFPANIIGPTGAVSGRAYVTDDRVRVYIETGGRKITLAVDEPLGSFTASEGRASSYALTTAAGVEYVITGGGGCGCGSPLKMYDPQLHGVTPPA